MLLSMYEYLFYRATVYKRVKFGTRRVVESSSTFCNKICTHCAFYQSKAKLFAASDAVPVYGVTPRNSCNLQQPTALNVGRKTRKVAFPLMSGVERSRQVSRFCYSFYHSLTASSRTKLFQTIQSRITKESRSVKITVLCFCQNLEMMNNLN